MFLGIGIGINRKKFGGSYAEALAEAYKARVLADGGTVESLQCFTNFAISWGAYYEPKQFNNTQWQLITTQWQLINTTWN